MLREYTEAWNRFWFTPRASETLAVIRIATGLMLAYVHAIWLYGLSEFFGKDAWLSGETLRVLHANQNKWSYLWSIESFSVLALHQWIAIIASMMLAAGCLTRIVAPLIWFMTLMVCHRMTGHLFGLDQIVMMLSMYLMFTPCGSVLSLDARLRDRFSNRFLFPAESPSVATNIATRLIQLHLCVIYLFGGLSKMRGDSWWDGNAIWLAAASYEYQSMDLTWIGKYPFLGSLITHVTVFWETFYCGLVWPRKTRYLMLVMAVLVHGGIALYLGMITFGTMMIVANIAFIDPSWFGFLKDNKSR